MNLQTIREKLSYEIDGEPGPFKDGFQDGLRQMLEKAIGACENAQDPSTDVDVLKIQDLFWYFRADRGEFGRSIEDKYKSEIQELQQMAEDVGPDYMWGLLSAHVATSRWICEEDREFADRMFPDLDS